MASRWARQPAGRILRLAVAAYVVLVLAVTVLPVRWDPWRASYPNDDFRPELAPLRGDGTNVVGSGDPLHMLAEHVGNVLLFAPFGFLLPLLAPRLGRLWQVVALGAATSLCIELAQIAMPGTHRADVDDLILNTVGAGCGWLLLRLAGRRAARRRDPGSEPAVLDRPS
jgi:glycopeptide antibiotics resistance protein